MADRRQEPASDDGSPSGTLSARRASARDTVRLAVVIGALGVVFGDIGTSPIYTLQTVFNPDDPHPVPVSTDNVYGVVSLVFWSVMIIVTVTYVLLAMRADNDGEGGIMALITLLRRLSSQRGRRAAVVLAALGIFGASLFFGDSMITPAISVLSAVEGLKVVEPSLEDAVVPDHRGDHRRAVPGAAQGNRGRGPGVRAGHDRLVRGHRRVRRRRHRRPPGHSQGAVTDVRAGLPVRPLRYRLLRAGRDRARGHRRRGALRRHGSLRPPGDHPRLAVPRLPRLRPELPRPGRADPRRSGQHQQPVLPARARLGTAADGRCWPRRRP